MSNQNKQNLTTTLLDAFNAQASNDLSQSEMLAAITALAATMACFGNGDPKTFIIQLCQSLINLNAEFIQATKDVKEVVQ